MYVGPLYDASKQIFFLSIVCSDCKNTVFCMLEPSLINQNEFSLEVTKCNLCKYKATEKGHPKSQVKSNHEGICNPYSQCDYRTTIESNFKKHDKA